MARQQKKYTEKQLIKIANDIRKDVIKMLVKAGSGHSAGSLGMADVFATLYFSVLNHDPKNPEWKDRDRFVLSAGHINPVWYATLAKSGYFPRKELWSLRKFGSLLQGHPHNESTPGVDTSSGPLGHGFAQAAGMAYAGIMDNKKWRVYSVMGDGELNEGNIWETAMFAGKNKLRNLTGIIDRNNIQIDGFTEDVMPLESLKGKFESFNWHVLDVDGHNIEAIIDACNQAKAVFEKPTMIIAHTIPGKGVHFMERDFKWHGIPPNPEEAEHALRHLRSLGGKIECGDH